MLKKFVYIGILLLAISIVLFFVSGYVGSSFFTSLQGSFVIKNVTIDPHGFYSLQVLSNTSTSLIFIGALNSSANMYLFNGSAYGVWSNELSNQIENPSGSGLTLAESLENKGVFAIYRNSTNATIPANSGLASASALYISNSSTAAIYPAGTYYFVVDNTHGSRSQNSTIFGRIVYLPPEALQTSVTSPQTEGQITQLFTVGVAFLIFFIGGIVVLAYGLVKKSKEEQEKEVAKVASVGKKSQLDQKYVDDLYKNVQKRKKASKRGGS